MTEVLEMLKMMVVMVRNQTEFPILFIVLLCACIIVAFQNGTSVTTPDSSQISSTWVVISWTPLTTVTDTRGNSNPVAGFYIFYQVNTFITSVTITHNVIVIIILFSPLV